MPTPQKDRHGSAQRYREGSPAVGLLEAKRSLPHRYSSLSKPADATAGTYMGAVRG